MSLTHHDGGGITLENGKRATAVVAMNAAGETIGGGGAVFGTLAGVNPGVIAAAGNYAAGDVLSNSATASAGVHWVFDGIAPTGGSGYITKVVVTCSAEGLLCRFRLHLFNAVPSGSELDDNEALSIVVADRAKWIGYVDLPAMADLGTMTGAQSIDVRLKFDCASDDDALYGILQTLDAETNEAASMTVGILLSAD